MSGRSFRVGLVAVLVVVVVVVAVVAVVAGAPGRHHRSVASPKQGASRSLPRPASGRAGRGLRWHAPPTVHAPGSPVQEEGNQAFTQGFSGAGLGTLSHLEVPAPAIQGGWPALREVATPETWASAFTKGLLDIDFVHQSRPDLGHWLMAEEAPLLLPGVPSSAADKILYVSVLEPQLVGGGKSPIPSATTWQQEASEGVTQSVSGLLVQVGPSWSRLVASGWQPPDPRMTVEDVSGMLVVHQGQTTTTRRFQLALGIGSARWHPGYGTIAVGGFSEKGS